MSFSQDVKNEIHSQFKSIFVDEYQDINPMQDAIIEGLKSENTKMFFSLKIINLHNS